MKISKFLKSNPLLHGHLFFEKIIIPIQKDLKKKKLTFRQSLILISLYFEEEPVCPKDMANALQTSASNMSHALKHLEAKRWVTRKTSAQDLRKKTIALTASGERLALKLIPHYNNIQNILEEHMGEKSLIGWNKKIEKMISLLANI